MTFDPMIITFDMLGLIGDYCGKIQLNSDKVRQSYIIETKNDIKILINTSTGCSVNFLLLITYYVMLYLHVVDNEKLTLQRAEVLIPVLF